MSRIVLVLFLSAIFGATDMHATPQALWDRANTAYINADYDNAILHYDSIRMSGVDSYKLYYNLGNAHFKKGNVGASILNYHRAHRLAPYDGDTNYNLNLANARAKDQITQVPDFFLHNWVTELRRSVGSGGWAMVSLVMLAVVLGGVLLYLLGRQMVHKKSGFYLAALGVVIFVFALGLGNIERQERLYSNDAVVMSSTAAIKSSPDVSSKDIFILNEGTVVRVVERLNGWAEIVIADGNKGWIDASSIEVI